MGTAPYHYVIGETAAAVLASEDGVDLCDFSYRRDRVIGIAFSSSLAHTVGTNGQRPVLNVGRRPSAAQRLRLLG